jgi:hypothetical protein
MWMINPSLMCNQHILGEHSEIHKHRHNFVKGHNLSGRIAYPSQIQPKDMELRHNALAEEMLLRGMNHNSPFIQPWIKPEYESIKVDISWNIEDLRSRCSECDKKISNFFLK